MAGGELGGGAIDGDEQRTGNMAYGLRFDELRGQGERGDQYKLTKMDPGDLEQTEMAGGSAMAATRVAARRGDSVR